MRISDIKRRVDIKRIREADPVLAGNLTRAWEHAERLDENIQNCDAAGALYNSWMVDHHRRSVGKHVRNVRGIKPAEVVDISRELEDLLAFVSAAPNEFRASGCRCRKG